MVLIWLCYEAFANDNEVSPGSDWRVKQYIDYGKNKVIAI